MILTSAALVLAAVFLHVLSLPPFNLFVLGFVILPPLLHLMERPRSPSPFPIFFVFSFLSYTILLQWIPGVMARHGNTTQLLGFLGLIALSAFLSLFAAAAGVLFKKILKEGFLPWLLIPAVWVAKDLVLENILGGFPWCSLGYSQHPNIPFIQVAEWGGIHLVTFLVVLVNVWVYRLWKRPTVRSLISLILILVCVHGLGLYLNSSTQKSLIHNPRHLAGILQPNTRNDDVFTSEKNRRILSGLLAQSETLHRRGAEFVVWPEFTIPVYPLQNGYYHDRLARFSLEICPLLAGFTDYQGEGAVFNSMLLYQDGGVTKYDKVHLAPFGEYIPLKGLLFFVEKITDEIGEFTPGTEIRNLILSGRRIATPICYELIYPRLVRDFIALGGELIVIASNDSWYGRSAAPHQLLAMSVFRSVENRRFTLRSTTSGISALISPTGVICERSGLDEKEALTVPFAYLNDRTVFTRFGFLFPHLCLVIAFLWLTSRVVRGWRRRHGLKAANSRSSSNSPQRAKNSSS